MKKIIFLFLILYSFYPAYTQDCFDKLAKQAVIIDSLQKAVNTEKGISQQLIFNYQQINKDLRDTIKMLNSDLLRIEKFKADKKNIDAQLKQKNDSIALLKNQISEKKQQILAEKQMGEQKSREEKEKGKNEALANVLKSYKNKSFDDLIKSSTKLSIQRDIELVGYDLAVKPILFDLEKYFNAKELLTIKIDATQINNAQLQLNQVKQQSELLEKLKENLKLYDDFNEGFKKTLEKLVDLDMQKVTANDSELQKRKFKDIANELTDYMYDYYAYGNYKYLSDLILEIIKIKKSNADADISGLLRKLQ